MIDHAALSLAIDAARRHEGKHRALAVTMECGHLRLMPALAVTMGVGAFTGCAVCAEALPEGGTESRMVIKIEETGDLHTGSYSDHRTWADRYPTPPLDPRCTCGRRREHRLVCALVLGNGQAEGAPSPAWEGVAEMDCGTLRPLHLKPGEPFPGVLHCYGCRRTHEVARTAGWDHGRGMSEG